MSKQEEALQRLGALAEKLNSESDAVNAVLEGVNVRLSVMNLGFPYWGYQYGAPILVDEPEGVTKEGSSIRLQVGYAKVEDKWQLAVRTVLITREQDETGEWSTRTTPTGEPKPLMKANRMARATACGRLPVFIDQLAALVEDRLKGIEAARGLLPTGGKRK